MPADEYDECLRGTAEDLSTILAVKGLDEEEVRYDLALWDDSAWGFFCRWCSSVLRYSATWLGGFYSLREYKSYLRFKQGRMPACAPDQYVAKI
jgi:hypothetical protein